MLPELAPWLVMGAATYMLLCYLHLRWICWHRAADKRVLGIPLWVQLPSRAREACLNRAEPRLAAVFAELRRCTGIQVWAAFGTALGLARHGSRIPWDDDYDFGMSASDWPRLKAWFKENGPRHSMCISTWWWPAGSCAKIYDVHTGEDLGDLFPVAVDSLQWSTLAWPSLQRDSFNKNIACPAMLLRGSVTDLTATKLPMQPNNTQLVMNYWFSIKAMQEAVVGAPHHPLMWLAHQCNVLLPSRFTIPPHLLLPEHTVP